MKKRAPHLKDTAPLPPLARLPQHFAASREPLCNGHPLGVTVEAPTASCTRALILVLMLRMRSCRSRPLCVSATMIWPCVLTRGTGRRSRCHVLGAASSGLRESRRPLPLPNQVLLVLRTQEPDVRTSCSRTGSVIDYRPAFRGGPLFVTFGLRPFATASGAVRVAAQTSSTTTTTGGSTCTEDDGRRGCEASVVRGRSNT